MSGSPATFVEHLRAYNGIHMHSKCCSPVFWLWCTTELIFGDSLTGTQDCAQLGLRLPRALCYLVLDVILHYFTHVNTRPGCEGQFVKAGMILAGSFKLLEICLWQNNQGLMA